jgi:hypothetical protein
MLVTILCIILVIDYCLTYNKNNKNTDILINELKLAQANPLKLSLIPTYGFLTIASDNTILDTLITIISIRKYSQLPIIIGYTFLSDINLNYIKGFNNITTVYIKISNIKLIPYLIITSTLSKVIYINPGIILLNNPDKYFNTNIDLLFFKDIQSKRLTTKLSDWIKKLIPYNIPNNTIINLTSNSYQTNDIIYINKLTTNSFLTTLWILIESDVPFSYLKNDKEIYWIAAELSNTKYIFNDYFLVNDNTKAYNDIIKNEFIAIRFKHNIEYKKNISENITLLINNYKYIYHDLFYNKNIVNE